MALSFAKGTLAIAAGATGSHSVSGLAFQPVAVIFFGASTNTTGSYVADDDVMLGFATSATQEAVICFSDNNQATNTANSRGTSTANSIRNAINGVSPATTTDYAADFTSMDATGFTVNVSNGPTNALSIHYLAIGGSDITNAKVGSFSIPTSGAIATTDPGFQPDLVLFAYTFADGTNGRFSMGAATSAAAQGGIFKGLGTGTATVGCGSQQRTDNILSGAGSSSITQDMLVAFSSMDATGFTLTASDYPAAATTVFYLAIKGGQWAVGSDTEGTSAAAKDTALSFTPTGLMLFGLNRAADSTYNTTADDTLTIGASDGTNEGCIWGGNDDGNTDSPAFKRHDTGRAFWHATAATTTAGPPTTDNEADCSFGTNKFTLTWTQAGSSRQFIYVAGGSAAAGGATTPKLLAAQGAG